MSRLAVLALLGALMCGCGPALFEGALRPESESLSPETVRMIHPAPRVDVSNAEFREAMARLAAEIRAARMTSDVGSRSGKAVLASWEQPTLDRAGAQLAREYSAWCQLLRHGPADCLSLGVESFGFESKRRLALSIAIGSVLAGATDVLGEFTNPLKVEAMIVASMATYLFLLCAPEPVTKGIAAVMTIGLYAYLGDELWNIARAYERMLDEVDSATTFAEIRSAGDRLGQAIGQNATRILIMMATARLGSSTESAIKQMPGFPRASRVVVLEQVTPNGVMAPNGALTLSGVLGTVSTAVLGKGQLNLVLGTGAVAMTASSQSGTGGSNPAGPRGDGTDGQATPSSTSKRIKDLLKPGDRWIGDKGTSTDIREIKGAGLADAQKLFDDLSAGGVRMTGTNYPGTLVRMPEGGYIGLRPVSDSGPPTVEIMKVPGLPEHLKIKFVP